MLGYVPDPNETPNANFPPFRVLDSCGMGCVLDVRYRGISVKWIIRLGKGVLALCVSLGGHIANHAVGCGGRSELNSHFVSMGQTTTCSTSRNMYYTSLG